MQFSPSIEGIFEFSIDVPHFKALLPILEYLFFKWGQSLWNKFNLTPLQYIYIYIYIY